MATPAKVSKPEGKNNHDAADEQAGEFCIIYIFNDRIIKFVFHFQVEIVLSIEVWCACSTVPVSGLMQPGRNAMLCAMREIECDDF